MKRYIVALSKDEDIANQAYSVDSLEEAEARANEDFPEWKIDSVSESNLDVPIS